MALMRKLVAALVLLSAAATAAAEDDKNLVLPPLKPDSTLPEKMLVFIPGGKVPNARYAETARAIQRSAEQLRLWVVVPAVFQRLCIISCSATSVCSPLHSTVEGALAEAAAQGWKRGKDTEDMWLAGHSLGGTCANYLFQAYSKPGAAVPYAGLVVMGGYVDETGAYDLTHFPVPVLTLNVELDGGLARPGKTAVWWRQHLALQAAHGEKFALAHKPVLVLPKLNHSDFCPGFDVPGDLPAEVPQAEATEEIGRVVAAFLHLRAGGAPSAAQQGLEPLWTKAAWTRQLLGPYLEAQDLEHSSADTSSSEKGSSPFCVAAQRLIAGLSKEDDARLEVADGFHTTSPGLMHCHPKYTASEGRLTARTCSHADYYVDVANTGEITAASEVACKMLSSDRVASELKTKAASPGAGCRAINRHAVEVEGERDLKRRQLHEKEQELGTLQRKAEHIGHFVGIDKDDCMMQLAKAPGAFCGKKSANTALFVLS